LSSQRRSFRRAAYEHKFYLVFLKI
jgi:hypothetical protein